MSARDATRRRPAADAEAATASAESAPALRPPRGGRRSTRNLHSFVADELGAEIVAGVHPPGSLLPSETVLRTRFQVSRTALREVFRVLTGKGLIGSRPKVGTWVQPKPNWNMLDPDVLEWHRQFAPSEEFISQLFELREMVEPPSAALAARIAKPETLARIAEAYARMDRCKDGAGDLIAADLDFHLAILAGTGNHFVGALGSLIHAALICSFQLGWGGATVMQHSRLMQHRAVMEAIRAREPAQAQARMTELLRDSIDDVLRALRGGQAAPAR